MALTEMQKKIINDNPTLTPYAVSKLAHCNPKTVKAHREKKKELPQGNSGKNMVKTGNSEPNDCACATVCETGNSTIDDAIALNNAQLDTMQSIFCVMEFNLYQEATKRLKTDPDNPKYLWSQKQHAELYQKGMFLYGKWKGKDKTVVDINVKNDLLTEKDLDTMSFDEITTVMINQCQQKQ